MVVTHAYPDELQNDIYMRMKLLQSGTWTLSSLLAVVACGSKPWNPRCCIPLLADSDLKPILNWQFKLTLTLHSAVHL